MNDLSFISGAALAQKMESIRLRLSNKDWHLTDALHNVLQIFFDANEMPYEKVRQNERMQCCILYINSY